MSCSNFVFWIDTTRIFIINKIILWYNNIVLISFVRSFLFYIIHIFSFLSSSNPFQSWQSSFGRTVVLFKASMQLWIIHFERRMTVHVIVKTKDTTNVIDVNGWLRPKELLWREYSCNLIKMQQTLVECLFLPHCCVLRRNNNC